MICLPAGAGLVRPAGGGTPSPWAVNMPFSGADGSTTFTDLSGKVWTRTAPAEIDTSLGYNTGLFTGGWLTTPNHADFDFGSGDFLIRGYVRPNTLSNHQAILGKWGTGGAQRSFFILYSADGSFRFSFTEAGGTIREIISAAGVMVVNTEKYFEITRAGSDFTIKVNGSTVASASYAAAIRTSTGSVYMGAVEDAGISWRLNARLRGNLQVLKGSATP